MIGTMEFIKCAGSLATAEYPLITSDDEMDSYVVKTYAGVQFVEDLQQSIVMPSFDGWSECNLVRFTQTNQTEGATAWKSYYWITNAVRSSDVDGCTTFYLEFDAVTTLLKKGDKVNGQWLRSPVNYTPWKQQNVISGAFGLSRFIEFPSMPDNPAYTSQRFTVYWVSITSTKNISTSKQGSLEIYGFPAYVWQQFPPADLSTNVYHNATSKFPTIADLLNGDIVDTTGLTADEVLDISITKCAPFDCEFTLSDDGNYYFDFKIPYSPELVVPDYYMYHMSDAWGFVNAPTYGNLELTDMEKACGQVVIRDTNGNTVGTIPTNWTYNDRVYYAHQLVIDFAQVYERIFIYDPSKSDPVTNALGVFQIPGAHIPYVGSSWDTYKAYSMSFDRESMEFGIEQAKQDRDLAIANAAVGTVANLATGNVAGAVSSAAGGVTAYYQQAKEEKATRFNQDLSERRVQAQPGTGYNVNYGLSFVWNEHMTPVSMAVLMPNGVTEDIFNEYIEDFGYPNEGEYEQTMKYGFYQGTVYTSPTLTGPRFDGLINSFNAGIRLIPPSGNQ